MCAFGEEEEEEEEEEEDDSEIFYSVGYVWNILITMESEKSRTKQKEEEDM